MSRPRNLGDQIKQLKSEGVGFSEIVKKLNCSKATVSYHLSETQKNKAARRNREGRLLRHPFVKKIYDFTDSKSSVCSYKMVTKWKALLYHKIRAFSMTNQQRKTHHKDGSTTGVYCMFTADDVIKKFGENPKCYLTGDPIDIYKPSTYHFDHIVPISRGGTNTIDNLGICTKAANQAKHSMTHTEFIDFCRRVIDHNDTK